MEALRASVGHSWTALSLPPGPAVTGGSMPGFSVWSLAAHTKSYAHTTGAFVVACVPLTAFSCACFKCSLCVTTQGEQRRSVSAARRSAAVKNTTWRESHAGTERFHSKRY